MDLSVNLLFQRAETPEVWPDLPRALERIPWVNDDATACVAIRTDPAEQTAWPLLFSRETLEQDLAQGLLRIVTSDPYHWITLPDSAFTPRQLAHRDAAWRCIRPIVEGHGGELFTSPALGPLVRAAAAQSGKHKKQIYRYLRRYWQGGQVPNALLPAFVRCGGRGKTRPCAPEAPKRGRKSRQALQTGADTGINVDERIRAIFRRGAQRFIHEQGMGLTAAFQALSKQSFATDEIREGVVTPVLLPAEERPTLAQFRYWYERERNLQQALIGRHGLRRYQLEHRAVLGSPRTALLGPGSMYY